MSSFAVCIDTNDPSHGSDLECFGKFDVSNIFTIWGYFRISHAVRNKECKILPVPTHPGKRAAIIESYRGF
jgi:hypothetical protein